MYKNISRRALMKGAAAASLAVAASTMLTGCSLANLSDILGLGPQKKSFTINDFSIIVTLKSCQYIPYYNRIIPTLEIWNEFTESVELALTADKDKKYQIIPSFVYANDSEPVTPQIGKGFDDGVFDLGERKTGDLECNAAGDIQWSSATLTLTLYENGQPTELEPITFQLKKG